VTPGRASRGLDPAVEASIRDLVHGRHPLLIVSDFDGTLSQIVLEPTAAQIVPAARSALRRLARLAEARPDRVRVVVLSGRAARDVATRVRVGGVAYHGNHGIEAGTLARGGRAEDLDVGSDVALESFVPGASALGRAVARELGSPPWLFVEDKGPSVAFHFRQAPDPEQARAALLEAIEAVESEVGDHGLAAIDGRRVIEFRPAEAGGKGTAVERLIERERPGSVLAMGDDRSDAEAFAAVRAARETGTLDGLTLAVLGARETPPEIHDTADAALPDPVAAARVLTLVARLLEQEGKQRAEAGSQTGPPAGR
jgi:trehalose-phosphatase